MDTTKTITVGTANATVSVKEIENIKGEPNRYIVIDTLKGRVHVSIGEKNFKLLQEVLTK